ncbi:hypothetical protein KI387_028244, partial [Taxus chinensis]
EFHGGGAVRYNEGHVYASCRGSQRTNHGLGVWDQTTVSAGGLLVRSQFGLGSWRRREAAVARGTTINCWRLIDSDTPRIRKAVPLSAWWISTKHPYV